MAGIHLFNIAVEGTEVFLPGGEVLLRPEHDRRHDEEAQDRYGHGRQRHAPLGHKHHHQASEELGGGADHGGQAVGQGLLQGADVVGHAAEDVAVGHLAEIAHRDPVDLAGKVLPHVPGQVQGHRRHDVVLHIGEYGAAQVEEQQQRADAPDCGQVDLRLQGVGDQVRDLAEEIGTDDRQDRAKDREQQRDRHGNLEFFGIAEHLFEHAGDPALALSGGAHSAWHHGHIWVSSSLTRPTLRWRAGSGRFPDRPGRSSGAPRGCPCPPSCPRPGR